MYRCGLLSLLFLLVYLDIQAQQLPIFTQYREYHGFINPASVNHDFIRYDYNVSAGISSRFQWAGKQGTPSTQLARGEYIYAAERGASLLGGGYIIRDATGPTGFTGIYGRLAGILLTRDVRYQGLSIGLNIGMVQHYLNASEIVLLEDGDALADQNYSQTFPDVGAGIFYYHRVGRDDNIYFGLSVPQTLGLDLTFRGLEDKFSTKRVQHYYALAGFYKYLSDFTFVELSAWAKYTPSVPPHFNINVRYHLEQVLWVGCGVSTNQAFHLETGIQLDEMQGFNGNFRIGYAYDYYFSDFGAPSAFGGSHEVNISYAFESDR